VRVAAAAARQWGVLSIRELRAYGLSDKAVAARVRRGSLHPLYRGVYAVGHRGLALEGRFLAAVKACGPGTVLSHFSAGALWGLVRWDDRYPEVTVPAGRTPRHRRLRAHQSSALGPDDTTRRHNIPVTTPARTLVDLSSVLPYKPLRRATREGHALGLVTLRQLTDALDRLAPRRGSANLRKIVATGIPPTRSELEDAVLDLIARGGLQPPDVNKPIIVDGRRVVPDFRWPAQRLVVEADGAAWHDHRLAREDDVERQAILEAAGERVVRVTWDQAIRHRRQTLARLATAGAPKLDRP
jgi:very-short-patch-repair endonuclease